MTTTYTVTDKAYVASYGGDDDPFGDETRVFGTLDEAVEYLLAMADGLIENWDECIGSTDDEKEKDEYRTSQTEVASAKQALRMEETADRRVSGAGWAFQVTEALVGDG
jgi:hypothetical protein